MLTILIKAYCVDVAVYIKSICLNKHYSYQNKIYYLNKIYFCFAKIRKAFQTCSVYTKLVTRLFKNNIDFMQTNIKKRYVLGWSMKKCGSFFKYVVL